MTISIVSSFFFALNVDVDRDGSLKSWRPFN